MTNFPVPARSILARAPGPISKIELKLTSPMRGSGNANPSGTTGPEGIGAGSLIVAGQRTGDTGERYERGGRD